jgi:membrane-associated PAP2 superfamily phosphatase
VLGLLAIVSLVFLIAPGLDLAVSRLFYDPALKFPQDQNATLTLLRDVAVGLEWTFAISVLLPLVLKVLFPRVPLLLRPRTTLFVVATFVLGPWLIVNGILKEFWGRARPREILEFGGDATFSPVWWVSDQCEGNCSFVSGEAASAFALVALVFLVRKEWRLATGIATLGFATAVSLARIAAGGHFVSDVLIAWMIVLCVMLVLQRVVLIGLPPAFDEATEMRAAEAGWALRRLLGMRRQPPAS